MTASLFNEPQSPFRTLLRLGFTAGQPWSVAAAQRLWLANEAHPVVSIPGAGHLVYLLGLSILELQLAGSALLLVQAIAASLDHLLFAEDGAFNSFAASILACVNDLLGIRLDLASIAGVEGASFLAAGSRSVAGGVVESRVWRIVTGTLVLVLFAGLLTACRVIHSHEVVGACFLLPPRAAVVLGAGFLAASLIRVPECSHLYRVRLPASAAVERAAKRLTAFLLGASNSVLLRSRHRVAVRAG
mmetsp:Transcript_88640/g.211646  ORF Transcript_88640/g.211646 Transcript_88640/m.211646 type:complete len:245 (+) Transcript_88640:42-776(+)